ncbi:MAG: hypothetical protein E6I79_10505 [Chloroflexi bacterium]|nr:MAG: hypothetical protein E6I79_10505 [Chloroflexota bacterium]
MLTPTPAITVAVKGTFVFQFSRGELERMKLRIAGFGKRQAPRNFTPSPELQQRRLTVSRQKAAYQLIRPE